MELSIKTIKELLLKHQAKPSKIMGQNFLIHNPTLNKIIETADLESEDTVLEIGPGLGTLTRELAKKTKEVIAIEKDNIMAEVLKETLQEYKNVEIITQDALLYNCRLKNYKLVANLPYYITSPVIRMFLEMENQPECMVVMVQKEVGQRICENPPNMSLLAVSVQFYAKAQIISTVLKECFWPKPKVDSAIIKIIPHKNEPPVSAELFFKIVKAGFSQPRKQLANNFSGVLKKDKKEINSWLLKNKINPSQRAETLNIKDWINLTNSLRLIKN